MSKTSIIEAAIENAYKLESLLRVLSLAVEGEQIAGQTFAHCGGGSVIDMAAEMAGGVIVDLEKAYRS